ncbi:quinoprotein relay system zinc metallohydrolase 2 [Methyloceanibacter caenitepidi]|uniref:Zn-dependent hydrolases, including glyoxylases n=1 Tax=Methyloceanibacter caenitepidi TaxID=1384459 RepID=A0A0A8JYY0_9HYPH|nr:quinoprotein relay system zinc metallohydrolase 2 [Methyloceanibacter caenitepidi]BAQ16008.1 Zn-dependent hydrolases, including glyoxylases [Methyloceanibacter caenitepidi]
MPNDLHSHPTGTTGAHSCGCGVYVLSRRNLILAGLVMASAPLLRYSPAYASTSEVSEVAPGVFVHQGRYEVQSAANGGDIANASFVVGSEAVAVIDTSGSAKLGAELRDAIRAVTDKPIKYVINTHMHPDHVFGNAAFNQDNPEFVGHYKLARALGTRKDSYLVANEQMIGAEGFAGSEIILPTLGIKEPTKLDLGDRELLLEPQPTAHTDNDMIVTDLKTNTLFLGDLLFSVHVPTIDGSITGWLAVLDEMGKRKAARVVPGHGPKTMELPQALVPEQEYLSAIVDDVRRQIAEGKTLEQATKTAGFTEKDAWKLFDQYHVRNVTAAYAELEWE